MVPVYNIFIPIILLLFFLSCNNNEENISKIDEPLPYTVYINISEPLLPSDDDSPEYLLGQPVFVFSDTEGNLYVADRIAMNIRVYDSSGTYKRTVGRRGRGPGEFYDINAMLIDSQNNIIVADQLNSRITYLTSTGETISTYLIDHDEMLWPRQIREINDDLYIYLYTLPKNNDPDGKMLHLFDREMNKVKSIILVERYPRSSFFRIFSELYPGHVWVIDDYTIVYIPPLFYGSWYKIKFDNLPDYTVTEYSAYYSKPFMEIYSEPLPDNVTTIHYGGEVIAADVKRQSLGIFSLSDGTIVIFYLQYEEDTTLLITELYTPDGVLIGKGQKDLEYTTIAHAFTILSIVYIDMNDTFYIIDDRDLPKIKAINLSMNYNFEKKY